MVSAQVNRIGRHQRIAGQWAWLPQDLEIRDDDFRGLFVKAGVVRQADVVLRMKLTARRSLTKEKQRGEETTNGRTSERERES